MADTNLNITVTTDSAALQDLITKLKSGTMTVADYNKTTRTLRAETIAGSQAQKDLGDVMSQVAKQSKSATVQEESLLGVIRANRRERFLYMFAITESMTAINAATGGQNAFAKSVSSAAGAVFGMKFALDAMGLSATAAWPVAIIVGAWTIIREILASQKKATEDLNAELKKQYDLEVGLGIISPSTAQANAAAKVGQASGEMTLLQAKRKSLEDMRDSLLKQGQGQAAVGVIEQLKTVNEQLVKQKTALLEAEEAYKKLYDTSSKGQKDAILGLGDIAEQRFRRREISSKEYIDLLEREIYDYSKLITSSKDIAVVDGLKVKMQDAYKQKLDEATKLKEKQNQVEEDAGENNLRIMKAVAQTEQENADYQRNAARNITIGGVSMAQGGTSTQDFEKRQKVVLEAMEGKVKQSAKETSEATRVIARSFDAVGNSISVNIVDKLGLANNLLGGFLKQLLSGVAQIGINYLTGGIAGLLGLERGGDVVPGGGSLQFAAMGGNYNYGKLQNVIVGERGPELMQVGTNGVRVMSNQQMGRMGGNYQGGTSGGGGMQVQVVPIISSTGLSVMVKSGQRIYNKISR